MESGQANGEFVTFDKHESSNTGGKGGENEKSEGKGKKRNRIVDSRLVETLASNFDSGT